LKKAPVFSGAFFMGGTVPAWLGLMLQFIPVSMKGWDRGDSIMMKNAATQHQFAAAGARVFAIK
jgi:hypothetical protein